MVSVFDGLAARAVRDYPRKDRRELRMRLAQVMSSIMFVLLTPDFFGVLPRKRRTRADLARRHADSFADLFLKGL